MTALIFASKKVRDRGDAICLTDLWKASGAPSGRAPNDWLALATTQEFVAYIEGSDIAGISGNKLVVTKTGRTGGTWGHWQIGMAYAKYLSPEVHAWCNSVVRAYMEGKFSNVDARQNMAMRRLDIQALNAAHRHLSQMYREGWAKSEIRKARTELFRPLGITLDPASLQQGEFDLTGTEGGAQA
jgi:hypothetical protein